MFTLKFKRFGSGTSLPKMILVACCFSLFEMVPPAQADSIPALLPPGASLSSIPAFNDYGLTTGLLEYELSPFGAGSAPSGVLLSFLSESTTNPFGSDNLVFGYDLSVGAGDVVSISLSGFAGFDVAVKASDNGDDYPYPTDVSRSSDGDVITFYFSGIPAGSLPPSGSYNFGPGNTSETLGIYTNAPDYVDPTAVVSDASGLTAQADALGPAAATPEPSTVSFCLLALGFMSAIRVASKGCLRFRC